jgi:asparagine synthase (glutamine-hydrolysing)
VGEFAGYIRLDGSPIASEVVARLGGSLLSAAPPRAWQPDRSAVFIEAIEAPLPGEAAATAPEQSWPNRIVLADGWLESPADVAAALGQPAGTPHRKLMAEAVMAWGIEQAADRLYGESALALWEADARRLTLARDPFGARPIYYYATADFILFATTLQTMLAHPETPRELDSVIIAHTMTQAQVDHETTIYRQVRRVLPGGVAVFERGQLATRRFYTVDRIQTVRLKSDDAYVEAARALLDRAVACRLPATGPFGTHLSGGFDSGGVAATAARLLDPATLMAYTRVPAAEYANGDPGEREMAGRLVAMYPNMAWTIIDDACDVEGDLTPEQEADALLVPRVDSFHRAWFESLVRAAQANGASMVLHGGAGNITLSYGGDASFAALPARAWPGEMRRLHRGVRANGGSIPRALATVGYHLLAPRALRRARVRMSDGREPWLQYCMISPDFLAEIDYDSHAKVAGHDIPFNPSVSHRETRLGYLQSQRGRDSRGYMRRRRTLQTRDPYRDRTLAEFCLGVPNDQYYRDGQSRWLARRVLADRVPAETLAQTHRGKQVPEWYGLATARRDGMAAAIDRIARSPAASRVLDMKRIRAALDNWPKDAEAAERTRDIHGHGLQRAISMGGFLLWHETRGE